jgi:putative transposase
VPLHVIQRGNNRGLCFRADADRLLYLRLLAEAATRHRCAIHAYVLMPNHVHLLATPERFGGVAGMMQDVGRRYVRLFNDSYDRTGTLWEGRYKSSLIDSESYLLTCHRYIESNPVRAQLVPGPEQYPWSSHRHYARGSRDSLITRHSIFERLDATDVARRRAFVALFETPLDDETVERIRAAVRKGWALGSEDFLNQVEIRLGRSAKPPKRGRPFKQAGADEESQKMLI